MIIQSEEDQQQAASDSTRFKDIWKLPCPPKIQFFIWKIILGGLATKLMLYERRISISPLCPRCLALPESVEHMIFHCPGSIQIWNQVAQLYPPLTGYISLLQQQSVQGILKLDNKSQQHITCLLCFTLRGIWLTRNQQVFGSTGSQQPAYTILNMFWEFQFASTHVPSVIIGQSPNLKSGSQKFYHIISINWQPPPAPWLKLNTDGAVRGILGMPGFAGAGYILRNHWGNHIISSAIPLGSTMAIVAETKACYLGLKEVVNMRPTHLHLEMDSTTLVHWLTSPLSTEFAYPWQLYHLITDIHKLLRQIQNVRITHIYREGNKAADALANRGADKAADPL